MSQLRERSFSPDGTRRVTIYQRTDGFFQIEVERKVPGDATVGEPAYWTPVGRDVILVDTIERARKIAMQELEHSR